MIDKVILLLVLLFRTQLGTAMEYLPTYSQQTNKTRGKAEKDGCRSARKQPHYAVIVLPVLLKNTFQDMDSIPHDMPPMRNWWQSCLDATLNDWPRSGLARR